MRTPQTGPVTIAIYEGSVKIAEKTYYDAPAALLSRWPLWANRAFWKIQREADARSTGQSQESKP